MLEAKNLSFEREEIPLFSQLNFKVQPSTVLQISGGNGVGKTTLLRILCGLNLPNAGHIFWQGTAIQEDPKKYQAQMSYLGHQTAIKAHLTLIENLQMMQMLAHCTTQVLLDEVLNGVGLANHQHKLAGTLSSGEQRRLALAKFLLIDVPLWILDEPFASLDRQGINLLEKMLTQHVAKGGMVVLTSHQPFKLENIQQTVLLLQAHE